MLKVSPRKAKQEPTRNSTASNNRVKNKNTPHRSIWDHCNTALRLDFILRITALEKQSTPQHLKAPLYYPYRIVIKYKNILSKLIILIAECTLAGALELASSRTVPFLWVDASDFTVIEKLAVAVFNQVI